MSTEIKFIDTTIRDGMASLWAQSMNTGTMLGVLPDLDQAGFESMEFLSPGTRTKKMAQDLGEDMIQWLKRGAGLASKTELRLHGGLQSGHSLVPFSVRRLVAEMAVSQGITIDRSSNQWNDFEEHKTNIQEMRRLGLRPVVNVIYSISPKHSIEYYRERIRQAAALKPYRLCFKDVSGLLTPETTRELTRIFMESANGIEVEFHAHSTNGLAPLNVLEAVKGGIRHIHTAVPPLANGTSQPSILNVASNLRALGFDPVVDETPLQPAMEKLTFVAHHEHFPIGAPRLFDQALYNHQVPGGMMSNLVHQLKMVGMQDRFQETLDETVRVRADFGYPIMVTPLAQFVGSQAAINVIAGERYKQVSDEVIQYALGLWGREAVTAMDQEVRAKILDRKRARELTMSEPPDPSLKELRAQYGENTTDEELILRFYGGEKALAVMGKSSNPEDVFSARQPVVALLEQMAKRRGFRHVAVQKGDTHITLSTAPERASQV